ncbi:MAG: hypothetical protein SCM11_02425 [Bacillota bacterium]|nr:hypothetical protein [Bacillota bacterium]
MNESFFIKDLRRLTLFMGAYGSGKSEISVNFAGWLHQTGHEVTLCDLDIINPFFRSADARVVIETSGIRLVAPVFAGTNVDVPAVPAEIFSVFDDLSRFAVLDIGGEDLGARVVATIKNRLTAAREPAAIYFVVNPYRPFCGSVEQIVRMAGALSQAAGMNPTGLVHNANLLEGGDANLLRDSWAVVNGAAEALQIPVVFAAAMAEAVPGEWTDRTPEGIPLLRLRHTIDYWTM